MIDSPLRLMLVDEDPVFRMGLRIWLEQTAGCRVVAEASQPEDALAILASRLGRGWSELDNNQPVLAADLDPDLAIDLVILDLGLGAGSPGQIPGLQLCGDIKTRYPSLPVLVLSAQGEPILAAAAQQLGADGFGLRSMPVQELRDWIAHLTGRKPLQPTNPLSPIKASPSPTAPGFGQPPRMVERSESEPTPRSTSSPITSGSSRPWAALRRGMRISAIQQIEAMMAAIEADQRRGRADLWTEAVMAGRYRELKAARWLMTQLLATPSLDPSSQSSPSSADRWDTWNGERWDGIQQPQPNASRPEGSFSGASSGNLRPSQAARNTPPPRRSGVLVAEAATPGELVRGDLPTLVFEQVFRTFQGCLDNTSQIPQETDILREDKKRELLYLTLRKFEDAVEAMGQANLPPGQLAEQSSLLLRDVWTATLTDFFGRYYTLQVTDLEQPVVPTLMAEAEVVQRSILSRIPLVPELLGHLVFQDALVIDGVPYPATTPQALSHSQRLLEHLLLQVANGVIQPLLNCFADVELLKKTLYQRRLMSSRDIERFRNDLSWRYRWDGLINDPKAIFESQYRLWHFTERGIQTQRIYAPRRDELDSLSGLQRLVTLTIEARDAVAPRFRSAISFVGSGVVYVLTDVIGRGIGLIGKGILRGVGNAWRDPRSSNTYRPPGDGPD
jgi:DNA-binding NarL/FixJ family response regulator